MNTTFSDDFDVSAVQEISLSRQKVIPLLEDVDGKLTFRKANLAKLFESVELKDKPTAVISIAGAKRLGKSFILNLLLRYLRKKGWDNGEQWLCGWNSRENPGFEWCSGDEGHTRGIVAWGEPIVVERPRDKKKIAVILLDTQGSFENGRSKEEDMLVFALSTLFSSLQFFNLHKQILESDLEYLQCFVECGNAFAGNENETNIDTGNNEPSQDRYFQDIGFLIRDWPSPWRHPYGVRGGNEYLDGIMLKGTKSQHTVKEYLRKTFRNIKCFLMPEPGRNVRVPKEYIPKITTEDLGEQFRTHLTAFANEYLHPNKINVKNVGLNENLTGNTVSSYMEKVAEELMQAMETGFSDEMPPLMEVHAKCINFTALATASGKFEEEVKKDIKDMTTPDWSIFEEKVKKATESVENNFVLKTRYGRKDREEDIRRLSRHLAGSMSKMKEEMQRRRVAWARDFCERGIEETKQKLSECIGKLYTSCDDLRNVRDQSLSSCFATHDMDSAEMMKILLDYKDQIKETVKDAMEAADKRKRQIEEGALGLSAVIGGVVATGVAIAMKTAVMVAVAAGTGGGIAGIGVTYLCSRLFWGWKVTKNKKEKCD